MVVPKAPLEEYIGLVSAEVKEQMKRLEAMFKAHEASFNVPSTMTMKGFGPDVSRETVPLLLIMFEPVIAYVRAPIPTIFHKETIVTVQCQWIQ